LIASTMAPGASTKAMVPGGMKAAGNTFVFATGLANGGGATVAASTTLGVRIFTASSRATGAAPAAPGVTSVIPTKAVPAGLKVTSITVRPSTIAGSGLVMMVETPATRLN